MGDVFAAGGDRGRLPSLKTDLRVRPIHHQLERRIEAHIFVAFLAYCLQVTLRAKLRPLAPGLTPRTVLEKLACIQMLDVYFPTMDGRKLRFRRYTKPEKDQALLLAQLKLETASATASGDHRRPQTDHGLNPTL